MQNLPIFKWIPGRSARKAHYHYKRGDPTQILQIRSSLATECALACDVILWCPFINRAQNNPRICNAQDLPSSARMNGSNQATHSICLFGPRGKWHGCAWKTKCQPIHVMRPAAPSLGRLDGWMENNYVKWDAGPFFEGRNGESGFVRFHFISCHSRFLQSAHSVFKQNRAPPTSGKTQLWPVLGTSSGRCTTTHKFRPFGWVVVLTGKTITNTESEQPTFLVLNSQDQNPNRPRPGNASLGAYWIEINAINCSKRHTVSVYSPSILWVKDLSPALQFRWNESESKHGK